MGSCDTQMDKGKQDLENIIPALNANTRARTLMEAWPRIVQFQLDGEAKPFYVVIDNGQMKLSEGIHPSPHIQVLGDAKEFSRVVRGEKDITHPLLFGDLRLGLGKNMEMITFSRILTSVTRKWGA